MSISNYATLRVAQEGNVLTVHLDRPAARNAINMQMVNDLTSLVDAVEDAADVDVLVLRGTPEVFSTGIDLGDFRTDTRRDIYEPAKVGADVPLVRAAQQVHRRRGPGGVHRGRLPARAPVRPRLAERQSSFCFNEVKLGFLPGMATFRLAKYVGLGRAKNLAFRAGKISAEESLRRGLIDGVCDHASFDEALASGSPNCCRSTPWPWKWPAGSWSSRSPPAYEDFLGHFLAAQHRAINSKAFSRLVDSVEISAPKSESPTPPLKAKKRKQTNAT